MSAEPTPPPLVEAHALTVRYRYQDPPVFADLSLAVRSGEKLALVGPSGCGKSTLLAHLAGLRAPQAGTVRLFGQDLAEVGERSMDQLRARRLGLVFQRACLLPYLSVRENLALAFEPFGRAQRATLEARIAPLLAAAGLSDRARARAETLSVGEAQRLAVLRALAKRPPLVLADEPTGSLDGENVDVISRLLCDEPGRTLIVATHDMRVARRCSRIVELRGGVLCEVP